MSLIDDYKNGKRYGVEWKAPTIQHMNNLVETVVISKEDSSNARSLSEAAKSESSQALTKSTAAESAATNASQNASSALTKSTEALNKSNEALTKSTTAESNSTEALSKATKAESDSSQALSNSQIAKIDSAEALEKANSAKSTAEGIDSKAQNALDNSTQALEKAETALEQVTESLGSKIYSNGELLNEVVIAQELGDSETTLVSQKALKEALDSKLGRDELYYIDLDAPPPTYTAFKCACDGVTDDRANFEKLAEYAIADSKVLRLRKGLTLAMNFDTVFEITSNFKLECEENSVIKTFQTGAYTPTALFKIDDASNVYVSIYNIMTDFTSSRNSSLIYGDFNGADCYIELKNVTQYINFSSWYGALRIEASSASSSVLKLGNFKLINNGSYTSRSALLYMPTGITINANIELNGKLDFSEYIYTPTATEKGAITYGKINQNLFNQLCEKLKNTTIRIKASGSSSSYSTIALFDNLNLPELDSVKLSDLNTYITPESNYINFSIFTTIESDYKVPAFKKGCDLENITITSDATYSHLYIVKGMSTTISLGYTGSLGTSSFTGYSYKFKNIKMINNGEGYSTVALSEASRLGANTFSDFRIKVDNTSSANLYCCDITMDNCIFKSQSGMFISFDYGVQVSSSLVPIYKGNGLSIINSKLYLKKAYSSTSKNQMCAGIRVGASNASSDNTNISGVYINSCDLLIELDDTYDGAFAGMIVSGANYNKFENINLKIVNTAATSTEPLWFISGLAGDSRKSDFINCKFQLVDKSKVTDLRVIELADKYNTVENVISNASPIIYNTENTTNTLSNITVDENLNLDLWSEDIVNG